VRERKHSTFQGVLPSVDAERTTFEPIDLTYARPYATDTELKNYIFDDAYGPYPIAGAALTAGIKPVR